MANDPCIVPSPTVALSVENDALRADAIVSPDPGNLLGARANGLYATGASGDPGNLVERRASGLYVANPLLYAASVVVAGGSANWTASTPAQRNGSSSATINVGPYAFIVTAFLWVQTDSYFDAFGQPPGDTIRSRASIFSGPNATGAELAARYSDATYWPTVDGSGHIERTAPPPAHAVVAIPPNATFSLIGQQVVDAVNNGTRFSRFGSISATCLVFRS